MTDQNLESIKLTYYHNSSDNSTLLTSEINFNYDLNNLIEFNISQIRFNNLSTSIECQQNVWQFFLNNRQYFIDHYIPNIIFSQRYSECPQIAYLGQQLRKNNIYCESSHYTTSSYTLNMVAITMDGHDHNEDAPCVCGYQSFEYYLKNYKP